MSVLRLAVALVASGFVLAGVFLAVNEGHRPETRVSQSGKLAEFDELSKSDAWSLTRAVADAMYLDPGMRVATVGLDAANYVPHLSEVVGEGGAGRVETIRPGQIKTRLQPNAYDRILIVNAWHELSDRAGYAKFLKSRLTEDGSVWIVDVKIENSSGPSAESHLNPKNVVSDLEAGNLDAEIRFVGPGGWDRNSLVVGYPSPEGGICEPVPAEQLEDCQVKMPVGGVSTRFTLRQICESRCKYIDNIWLQGLSNGLSDLKDLSPLSNKVVREVVLEKMKVESLRGLQLESGGSLSLMNTPLEKLEALQGMKELSGLFISGPWLRDLKDLRSLRRIVPESSGSGGSLGFRFSGISDFSPIEGVNVTDAHVQFYGTPGLTAFPEFKGAPSEISLYFNDNLTDISAFRSLDRIKDSIIIRGNPSLSTCHIEDVLDDVHIDEGAKVVVEGNKSEPCN
jgi:hypothetical protein